MGQSRPGAEEGYPGIAGIHWERRVGGAAACGWNHAMENRADVPGATERL